MAVVVLGSGSFKRSYGTSYVLSSWGGAAVFRRRIDKVPVSPLFDASQAYLVDGSYLWSVGYTPAQRAAWNAAAAALVFPKPLRPTFQLNGYQLFMRAFIIVHGFTLGAYPPVGTETSLWAAPILVSGSASQSSGTFAITAYMQYGPIFPGLIACSVGHPAKPGRPSVYGQFQRITQNLVGGPGVSCSLFGDLSFPAVVRQVGDPVTFRFVGIWADLSTTRFSEYTIDLGV